MTVVHSDAHTHEQFSEMSAGLGLCLIFVHFLGLAFYVFSGLA